MKQEQLKLAAELADELYKKRMRDLASSGGKALQAMRTKEEKTEYAHKMLLARKMKRLKKLDKNHQAEHDEIVENDSN